MPHHQRPIAEDNAHNHQHMCRSRAGRARSRAESILYFDRLGKQRSVLMLQLDSDCSGVFLLPLMTSSWKKKWFPPIISWRPWFSSLHTDLLVPKCQMHIFQRPCIHFFSCCYGDLLNERRLLLARWYLMVFYAPVTEWTVGGVKLSFTNDLMLKTLNVFVLPTLVGWEHFCRWCWPSKHTLLIIIANKMIIINIKFGRNPTVMTIKCQMFRQSLRDYSIFWR